MTKKKHDMTAAEFMAELATDQEYLRKMQEIEHKMESLGAELTLDERSLVSDLADVGVIVESVWDLVNSTEPYPMAIRVLLDHLRRSHQVRTREGIARALTVPESRGVAFDDLYEQFVAVTEEEAPELAWLLAAALSESVATESETRTVIDLLQNPGYGKAREMLMPVLVYLPDKEKNSVLNSLSDDPCLREIVKTYR